MQYRPLCLVTCLGLAGFTSACSDLGKCDMDAARRPVLTISGQLAYEGQNIIALSCATGCHLSAATGGARKGAPKGLDFDINPVASTSVESVMTAEGKASSRAVSDPMALANLRARQRIVFDQRNEIWDQVESDMMPPKGVGEAFRDAMFTLGTSLTITSNGTCTRGSEVAAITDKTTRESLRNWLACGAPVIETENAGLAIGPSEKDPSKLGLYSGSVGDQYPVLACDGNAPTDGGVPMGDGGTDGGSEGSFASMYAVLMRTTCTLSSCHGMGTQAVAGFSLTTPAEAYTTLLGANMQGGAVVGCPSAGKPYVTPNNPERSYLLDKVQAGPACGSPMPLGSPTGLQAADLAIIRAWIMAGAPPP